MLKQLLILVFLFPASLVAQNDNLSRDVNWHIADSWEAIIKKAALENKMIFVDCYATWCAPCKEMDRVVFSSDTVASLMNKHFINIKLQLDVGKNDNEFVKSFYKVAEQFKKEFQISGVPTFLFFSPTGAPLHKEAGAKNINSFISLANDARNPKKQFFTLLNEWKLSAIPIRDRGVVAIKMKTQNENVANEIAANYKEKYLSLLPKDSLFKKENINFLVSFPKLISIYDNEFDIFYNNSLFVDSLLQRPGLAGMITKQVITNSVIDPLLTEAEAKGNEPNWKKIRQVIRSKFNPQIANATTINSKIAWYYKMQDWEKWFIAVEEQIDQMGLDKVPDIYLNSFAWRAVGSITNKKLLKKALKWVELAIVRQEQNKVYGPLCHTMDTKSWILFKLGKTTEAIAYEQHIIVEYPQYSKIILPSLDKMRRGENMWSTK